MADTTTPETSGGRPPAGPEESRIWGVVWTGVMLAVVGVVVGVAHAVKRQVAQCPDGHYFPPGTTDFTCYVHPHAVTGISIAIGCTLLGMVVWLSGVSAAASVRGKTAATRDGATAPPS
jgi:hypothetical protein